MTPRGSTFPGSVSRRRCAACSTSRTCSAPWRPPPARRRAGCDRRRGGRRRRRPGRFEPVDEGQRFTVLVDYAHTPIRSRPRCAPRALSRWAAHRRVRRRRRPRPGEAAAHGRIAVELADVAIVTSDNPRGEDPSPIIQDVLQGAGLDAEIDPTGARRSQRAIARAEPGDVVVIAGKGHEQGQEIAGVVHPFDDPRGARREARSGAQRRPRASRLVQKSARRIPGTFPGHGLAGPLVAVGAALAQVRAGAGRSRFAGPKSWG